MYNEISSNKIKSATLIIFFIAFVVLLGYFVSMIKGYEWVFPLAIVIAIIETIGGYYYGDKIILAVSKARPATRQENAHLVNSVEGLAIAAGIPAPPVYVIDDTALNAFATGRDPKHAVIVVTTGLLDKLNRVELEGVIAHEMSHIKNYDIRLMALVAVLAGTVILISDMLTRRPYLSRSRDIEVKTDGGSKNISSNFIFTIVLLLLTAIVAPLFAQVIKMYISRQREYLADASGALLTRYPEGLASALEKISHDVEVLEAANKATAHLFIASPLLGTDGEDIGGFFENMFSTHPPIGDRIKRLRSM